MSLRPKIAVIGSGIAGVSASYLLQNKYEVWLFEKDSRLGGHTHTIEVPQADQSPLGVDTGFIVFNDRNYPHFVKFLEEGKKRFKANN